MTDYRIGKAYRFELTKKRIITGTVESLNGSKINVLTKYGEKVRFDDSEVVYSIEAR